MSKAYRDVVHQVLTLVCDLCGAVEDPSGAHTFRSYWELQGPSSGVRHFCYKCKDTAAEMIWKLFKVAK